MQRTEADMPIKSWIKFDTKIYTHRKTIDLSGEMDWSIELAVGKIGLLWIWACDHAEDGVLEKLKPKQIAGIMHVERDQADKLYKTLVECGFLDKDPLRIHDWIEYHGRYLILKYQTFNPAKLQEIWKIYGGTYGRLSKDYLKDNLYSISKSYSSSKSKSLSQSKSPSKAKKELQDNKSTTVIERIEALKRVFEDETFCTSLRNAYDGVVLEKEKKRMIVWIEATPKKSNKSNWKQFINNWFRRAQADWEAIHGSGNETDAKRDRAKRLKSVEREVELH